MVSFGNNRNENHSFDTTFQNAQIDVLKRAIADLEAAISGGGNIEPGNSIGDTTYWDGTIWKPTDNVAVFPDDHIQHLFTDGSKTYRYYGGLDTADYYINSEILNNYAHLVSSTSTGNRRMERIYDDVGIVRIDYDDFYDTGSGGVTSAYQMYNELTALIYAENIFSSTGSPSTGKIVDFYDGTGIGQQTVAMATDGLNNTYGHLMYDMLGLAIMQNHLYSVDATNNYFYDYLYDSTGAVLQFRKNVGVDQITGYVTDAHSIFDNLGNTRISENRYFDGLVDSVLNITLFDSNGLSRYQHYSAATTSGSEDFIATTNLNRSIGRKTNTFNVFGKDSRTWEYGVSKAIVNAGITGDALVTVCDSNDNKVYVTTGTNYLLQFLISGVNLTTGNFESFSIEMCSIFIKWESGGGAPTLTPLNTYNANTSDLGALPLPDVGVIVSGNNVEIQANCGIGSTDTYRYTIQAKLIDLTNI